MRQDKRNILVTRPLSGRQIQYARILGLEPIIKPALDFNFPQYWDEVLRVVNEHPKSDWVFTSQNAVKALEELMESGLQVRPETNIFAVGAQTQKALAKLGLDSTIPRTQDGKHLAELIVREGKVNSVIYFHGNLSRKEVVPKLVDNDIEVIELEVYQTIIQPVPFPDAPPISAVLFYSPSAVEAFKRGHGFDDDLPLLFAIGPTTAGALKEEGNSDVKIAGKPDTEVLLRMVSKHVFSEQQNVK